MRLPRIIPTSATGRTTAAVAAVSLTAGVALVAVGLGGPSAPGSGLTVDPQTRPVAVARAGGGAGSGSDRAAYASGVRLADYDPAAGRARLVRGDNGASSPADGIEAGDVIASPPTAKARNGALFKVRTVTPTGKGIEVTTEPATLADALGSTEVARTIDAPALDMTVTPLAAGVRPARSTADLPDPSAARGPGATPTPAVPKATAPKAAGSARPATTGPPATATPPAVPATPDTARSIAVAASGKPSPTEPSTARPVATPSSGAAGDITVPGLPPAAGRIVEPARMDDGGLLLGVDIPLAGVPGITGTGPEGPKLAGWVALTPELIFSFGRKKAGGDQPLQAEIGVAGAYRHGFRLHAKLEGLADTGEKALRLPFAEVHLTNTFWVGAVPIVLSVDLTYFYRLTARGELSIDAEQSTKGEFALGARYDSRDGWRPVNRNELTTRTDGAPAIAGRGDARATIGVDLTVLLYGSAGVTGRLAPYLRAAVDARTPSTPRWDIYAGYELTGALSVRLKIFGTTLLRADVPVPPVHAEWKVTSSAPAPPGRRVSVRG